MSRDTKELVKEIVTGIVLYNIAASLLAIIFFRDKTVFLGLILGMAVAIAMIIHMAISLERSLDTRQERAAEIHTRKAYAIRMLGLIIVLFAAYFLKVFHVLAVLVGALGLKAGVYLQPVVHKTFKHMEK